MIQANLYFAKNFAVCVKKVWKSGMTNDKIYIVKNLTICSPDMKPLAWDLVMYAYPDWTLTEE